MWNIMLISLQFFFSFVAAGAVTVIVVVGARFQTTYVAIRICVVGPRCHIQFHVEEMKKERRKYLWEKGM